ncbi:PLD nuclease N-terminal domain-containing protein [Catenuloplanes japonicus]|uniref:PLD nuclease N-terminal domain-containing protein n=1 Tax=Catenuloplanes japonicus TaxID=33876 RepID=UPI000526E0B7|nr:PLD nuclease N-terminal domain-containing protein [Catenuloplanes japonicus]
MARLFALVFLLQIAMAVVALISCLSAEPGEIRSLPRLLWAAVIILLPVVGPVLWFIAGRDRPGAGSDTAPPRPPAPDDDPDFLRTLDADKARRDRELFERWEDDLRRREDEARRNENDEA